jgi:hypothetical protein
MRVGVCFQGSVIIRPVARAIWRDFTLDQCALSESAVKTYRSDIKTGRVVELWHSGRNHPHVSLRGPTSIPADSRCTEILGSGSGLSGRRER